MGGRAECAGALGEILRGLEICRFEICNFGLVLSIRHASSCLRARAADSIAPRIPPGRANEYLIRKTVLRARGTLFWPKTAQEPTKIDETKAIRSEIARGIRFQLQTDQKNYQKY